MKIQNYLIPNRNGEGLTVFFDYPSSVLNLKANESDGQYFLMYFHDAEKDVFEESCNDSDVITLFDNSYFEYKLEGKTPDMELYSNIASKYQPNIVMADIDAASYTLDWSKQTSKSLIFSDKMHLMVIPHGNTLDEMADIIYKLDSDPNVDVIGLCYQYDDFSRMDVIAHCIATKKWCWNKPVHLLGLSSSNEILEHRDLIRICQNIKSLDTSYPVLLGCKGYDLTVKNDRFVEDKPTCNILNCPNCNPYFVSVVEDNTTIFRNAISDMTSGYAKIALVGAAGTGKTTESEYLKKLLKDSIYVKYPPIHTICDYRDSEKADLATSIYAGCNLMAACTQYDNTSILDRCLIDNIAYATLNKNELQVAVFNTIFKTYCNYISSIVWVFPLEGVDIEDDGKRIVDKDAQSNLHDIFGNIIGDIQKSTPSRKIMKLSGNQSIEERAETILKTI